MFSIKRYLKEAVLDDALQEMNACYARKYHIASLLQPASIVEIGVKPGYAACAFLEANPQASYLGIDSDPKLADFIRGHFPGSDISVMSDFRKVSKPDLIHVNCDQTIEKCLTGLNTAAAYQPKFILVGECDTVIDVRRAVDKFLNESVYRYVRLGGEVLMQSADEELVVMPKRFATESKESSLWKRLVNNRFHFMRSDGFVIGTVKLDATGSITEYSHFNERYWRVRHGLLEFVDEFGKVSTRFVNIENDTLSGPFIFQPHVIHKLVKCPE
jgi:hypothetical protein